MLGNAGIEITVVIVNWNSGDLLRKCVASIPAALDFCGGRGEVIVVDNNSSDYSMSGLMCDGVPLHIVRNPVNRGFGAACNQGAVLSAGEYLLFLNPDTVLERDAIATARAEMIGSKNVKIGVCGIGLRDEVGNVSRSCARFPSPGSFIAHSTGIDRLFPRLGYFMAEWDHRDTRVVDHVMGAFFLMSRELFGRLGGFDEGFFVYLEDLDLSLRVRNAGYSSLFVAGVAAYHKGGGTSSQVKAARLFYSLRSRIQYSFKHFSVAGAWCVVASTLLIEPLTRLGHCVFRGAWADARHTLEGYGMLLRALPGVLRRARGDR